MSDSMPNSTQVERTTNEKEEKHVALRRGPLDQRERVDPLWTGTEPLLKAS